MTETATTQTTQRRRRTYIGLWVLAAVGFIGLTVSGYPALGAGAYFIIGAVAILSGRNPEEIFDERDATILEVASANTIKLLSLTSAVVFPTVSALAGLGYIEFPLWLSPIGVFVALLYVVWFGMILFARHQR